MAQLVFSPVAQFDLERLTDFLLEVDPLAAVETVELIEEAVEILKHHPLIGRPAESGLRELVISRGKTGYIVLYRFKVDEDAVLIFAIRHQREVGYSED